jgi:integrase/recombinase XerD
VRLSETIDALCMATRADGRSPETVKAYRSKLRPLVNYLGTDALVESITADDLRRYIADQMDTATKYTDHPYHDQIEGKLSSHTIAGRVRTAKRLFNWLEQEGVIQDNPTRRIKTPRPKRAEPKAIKTRDFVALLATTRGQGAADSRDRAIILTLADTGIRVGGLCGLRVQDIRLDDGFLVTTEKGGKSRLVPFTPLTREALEDWLEVRPRDQGEWLFVSQSTNPTVRGALQPGGVIQMLKRRARDAGVEGLCNPHSFRHFFAREFLLSGGDLGTLADLMGHSSVEVTKGSYAIFTAQELKAKHAQHSPLVRVFRGDGVIDRAMMVHA